MKQRAISKIFSVCLLTACVSLLTSCATLFNGPRADIVICSDVSGPVDIIMQGDTLRGHTFPDTLSLRRKRLNDTIAFSTPDRLLPSLVPGRRISTLAALDLYFTGLGVIADFATGSVYRPAQQQYFIKSVPLSDSVASLPVRSFRSTVRRLKEPPYPCRHELALGMGFGSSMGHELHRAERRLDDLIPGSDTDDFICGIPIGTLSLDVAWHYHLDRHWAVGVETVFTYGKGQFNRMMETGNGEPDEFWSSVRVNSFIAMPSVKYHWAFFTWGSLWSRAAVGAATSNRRVSVTYSKGYEHFLPQVETFNRRRWLMACQLSPVGVEMGTRWLRFFVEAGWGVKGIVNLGFVFCL